jgi:hypothetical protein
MSASIVHAVNGHKSSHPGLVPAAAAGDLVGARLKELDKRIAVADRNSAGAGELADNTALTAARNAAAVSPRDRLDNLAGRVARLAEADDRTVRLSEEVTAAPPVSSSRQSPRLADLIKQKRAEIERYEAVPPGTLDWNGRGPPSRSAHNGSAAPFTSLHFNGVPHAHAASAHGASEDPILAGAHFPTLAPAVDPTAEHLRGGHAPPLPPPEADERSVARTSRYSEDGLSSSLYGFGAGLAIALVSGAALYVVLRLV